MSDKTLAGTLTANKKIGRLRIDAHVDDGGLGEFDQKYLKADMKKHKDAIGKMQDMLNNWDDKKIADEAKKSLRAELAVRKAHLQVCKARCRKSGLDDDNDED